MLLLHAPQFRLLILQAQLALVPRGIVVQDDQVPVLHSAGGRGRQRWAAVPAAAAAAAVDEVAAGEAAAADKQAAAGAEAHTEAAATAQADSAASGKAAAEAEAELAVLDLAAGGDRSDSDSGSSSGDDLTADDPPPPELDALLLTLLDCSCVLGMHPDAATEPAVALALALNKPFAVVPCCLCSQQFPKRRRADGGPVGSTAELISYICEIAAAAGRVAHVVELPFEGKNVLVYSHSTHERGPDSS